MTKYELLYLEGLNNEVIEKLKDENKTLKKENLRMKSIITQISRKMDFVVTTFI